MRNIEFKEKWLLLAKVFNILSEEDILMEIMNFLFFGIEEEYDDTPNGRARQFVMDIIKDDIAN